MTTNLENIVAIRTTRGDVLPPAAFQSITAMLQSLLDEGGYSDLVSTYTAFLAHTTNYDDPHDDGAALYPVIAETTYQIYLNMTATPLSYTQFSTQIVPTLAYPELNRRILLNRYLYNQVKNSDGSVPISKSVTLPNDWGFTDGQETTITLTFGSGITTENQFIQLGWNANTTPVPVIFTANNLLPVLPNLPLLVASSSGCPLLDPFPSIAFPPTPRISLNLAVTGTPSSQTQLCQFGNESDVFVLSMSTSKTLSMTRNGVSIYTPAISCGDGKIALSFDMTGNMYLCCVNQGLLNLYSYFVGFSRLYTFDMLQINVGMEDITQSGSFGLRNLELYAGSLGLTQIESMIV